MTHVIANVILFHTLAKFFVVGILLIMLLVSLEISGKGPKVVKTYPVEACEVVSDIMKCVD